MSLIALAEFKSFLHMSENFDDVLLQGIIDGEEAEVSVYMNQDLNQVTAETEYHDGNRDNTILLNHGLVTAVTTVKIDNDNDGVYENTLTYWTDYVWYPNGVIQLQGGYFPVRMKLVEVIYNHGYATNPTAVTNLPTNIGFAVYNDRPVMVCNGLYSGLAAVVLNSAAGGAGVTYAESIDYAVMDNTGEVVLIETGAIADGATVYIESGTYSQLSNLPLDLRIALKKKMTNTYQSSHHAIETEGPEKEFNETYLYKVFDKYARLAI